MKRQEILFSIIAISIILILIAYRLWKNDRIDSDGIYVLAKITSAHETENAVLYDFSYRFEGKIFNSHFKGFLNEEDSFFFLHISKAKPDLWKVIEDVKVGKCYLTKDSMDTYWPALPLCLK